MRVGKLFVRILAIHANYELSAHRMTEVQSDRTQANVLADHTEFSKIAIINERR